MEVDEQEVLVSASMAEAQRKEAEKLQAPEESKLRRTVRAATSDEGVRLHLRHLAQPVCLFGEDVVGRRERLKELVAARVARGLSDGAPEQLERRGGLCARRDRGW